MSETPKAPHTAPETGPETAAPQTPDTPVTGTAEAAAEAQAPAQDAAPAADAAKAPAEAADAQAADAKAAGKDGKKEKKDWFGRQAKELEAVKAKLDAAEKKAAESRDQLLRTAAEYDNFRKRSAREADQKFNDGISFAVNQILPILDTLEMAAKTPCQDEAYKKGVTMTLDKAAKALAALQITEIEAEGKPFDPAVMNAVSQVPAPEGVESGAVVTVYQKGYRIGDKIIRHATVVVAE